MLQYLRRLGHVPSAILVACFACLPSGAQQPTRVTLGPSANLNYASFSEDFSHVAYIGGSGTRQVVYWDGKAGPEFDKVASASPILSRDGLHCAYSAQRGAQAYIVVDNKEYGPFDTPTTGEVYRGYAGGVPEKADGGDYNATPFQPIVFSPDGSHSAFLAKRGNHTLVFEDGKQVAAGKLVIGSGLQFSSRGNHLAFALQDDAQRSVTYYMDGVAGPVFFNGHRPEFSEDGHHLFYVAEPGPGSEAFVLDGKADPTSTVVREVHVSDDGAHYAYVAAPTRQEVAVVLDGKAIAGAQQVWLSPNGAHVAYFQPTVKSARMEAHGLGVMVVDGKAGQTYQRIESVLFAPDDGRVIYVATNNRQTVVVDRGAESPAYNGIRLPLLFSRDGHHMEYVASDADGTFVVLDGKPSQHFTSIAAQTDAGQPRFLDDGSLSYVANKSGKTQLMHNDQAVGEGSGLMSPNGRRTALLTTTGVGSGSPTAQITLDGVSQPKLATVSFLVFSPDSRHFAYVGTSQGRANEHQLFVDGVSRLQMLDVGGVLYSPDSQHLVVRAVSHSMGTNDVLYLDEKPVLEMPATAAYSAIVHWSNQGRQLVLIGPSMQHTMTEVKYGSGGPSKGSEPPTVDQAEAARMLGSGNRIAAASLPSSSRSTFRSAGSSNGDTRSGTVTTTTQPSLVIRSGTSVAVQIADAVDSHTPAARYSGALSRSLDVNGRTIPAGSHAQMRLSHAQNGWTLTLVSLDVDGGAAPVGENTMSAPGNDAISRAKNTVNTLGGFAGGLLGRVAKVPKVSVPMADQLVLPAGTTLTFTMH